MTIPTQMPLDEDGPDGVSGRRRIHLREISGDSESPLETVGQDLRAARLRRGDEIAMVSRSLKIRKDHLEALENDRLEDLPGKTYAIGFVRSYARYLGLDSAVLTERYKQEISGRPDDATIAVAPIHQDDSRRLPQGWGIVALIVAALLGYGGWHLLMSDRNSSQPVPPAPVLVQAAPKPAAKPVAVVQNTQPPAAAPNTADQNAPAQSVPGQPASVQAAPVQTVQTAQAAKPTDAGPAVPAVAPADAAAAHNARVILRARGATRITVRDGAGRIYANRDLRPGDIYPAPDVVGLSLATSNAGALEIDLDGIALGRVGREQQVVGRISLDPQALVDHFNIR